MSLAKFRCPFHEERTPSANIYSDGKFMCFGCSAEGTWTKVGDVYEITSEGSVRRVPCRRKQGRARSPRKNVPCT